MKNLIFLRCSLESGMPMKKKKYTKTLVTLLPRHAVLFSNTTSSVTTTTKHQV